MPTILKIPTTDAAIAQLDETGATLRDTLLAQVQAQYDADDMLEQLINSKIGSPNPMTGKNHSRASAEEWAKNTEEWRNCRREVVRLEGEIEWFRVQVERATLMARLAVLQEEQNARAA